MYTWIIFFRNPIKGMLSALKLEDSQKQLFLSLPKPRGCQISNLKCESLQQYISLFVATIVFPRVITNSYCPTDTSHDLTVSVCEMGPTYLLYIGSKL